MTAKTTQQNRKNAGRKKARAKAGGKKFNVLDQITARIIEVMESGELPPWAKPWAYAQVMRPMNHERRPYRGINLFWLSMVGMLKGYDDPRWITFNQAKARDGHVRKGEKSNEVVFWKFFEIDTKTGKPVKDEDSVPKEQRERRMVVRYYRVFNIEQCDGLNLPALGDIPAPQVTLDTDPQALIDAYLEGESVDMKHSSVGNGAFYHPAEDRIVVPSVSRFDTVEDYYSTAFHEIAHSTGHKSRLDRGKGNVFGSHAYGQEELLAEMTAALLCSEMGVHPAKVVDNNTAYLASWLKTIKEDPTILTKAAQRAQKAFDLVIGYRPEARVVDIDVAAADDLGVAAD